MNGPRYGSHGLTCYTASPPAAGPAGAPRQVAVRVAPTNTCDSASAAAKAAVGRGEASGAAQQRREIRRQPRLDLRTASALGPAEDDAHPVGQKTRLLGLDRRERHSRGSSGHSSLRRHPTQLSAVHRALHAVVTEVLRNHLRHCATHPTKAGPKEAEAMYDELIDLVKKINC